VFVLRLLGYDNVKNHDASWNDWGNRDDTPIVEGQ
jgi:3-mercaptopyruvate sulfurtransferase SseA